MIERNMANIEGSDVICPENKELIVEFKRDFKLDNVSDTRIQKVTSHLKIIAEYLEEARFEDLEKDDVRDHAETNRGTDTVIQSMLAVDFEMVAACPLFGPAVQQRLTAPDEPFFLFRELGERNTRLLNECSKRLLPPEVIGIRATA